MESNIGGNDPFLSKVLFPQTQRERVFYHICFWVLYVLLHYAYSIPTLLGNMADPGVTIVGFIYFIKIIPEYYCCVWIYNLLRKRYKGLGLGLILFLTLITVKHVFNTILFLGVDHFVDLKNMSQRFQIIAHAYLNLLKSPTLGSSIVIVYDLSEIELLLLPVALKMAKYAVKERVLRQKFENETLSMELKMLKSQINPHFVFNILNAAYAKILPLSEEAASYLQKASGVLRFTIYEANEEFIKLSKEISYLNQYVELESIRSNKRCNIEFKQEGLVRNDHKIPTLLLITLVENAFKHGVHSNRHNSYVRINSSVVDDILIFHIANSKPRQPVDGKKSPEKPVGLGLTNLRKRLEVYYPNWYKFEKKESDEMFSVLLELHLK